MRITSGMNGALDSFQRESCISYIYFLLKKLQCDEVAAKHQLLQETPVYCTLIGATEATSNQLSYVSRTFHCTARLN